MKAGIGMLERLDEAQAIGRIGDWDLDVVSEDFTCSAQVFSILGRDKRAGALKTYNDFVSAFDAPSIALMTEKVALAIESGKPQEYEVSAVCPDGERINLSARAVPLRNANGRVTTLHGTVHDITQQKLGDMATARLLALVDSSEDAIICKDLKGIVTSWNGGAERLFGYTASEMIGQSIQRLIPHQRRDEEKEIIRRVMRGESLRHYETERRAKDGHILDVSVTISAIKDSTGRIVGASKVAHDIGENRRALKTSELRYRRLFEMAKEGILILDADTGVVVDVNPFLISLLGYSHEQFLGKAIWELGFLGDLIANKQKFAELREKDYVRYENLAMESIDRRRIEVELISSVYLVDGGKVIQCVVRDVTERRETERVVQQLNASLEQRVTERTAELESANKELEAFSYSVSHDLRAPLRAVDGFSQAVLEDYGPQLPEEARRYLRTIRGGAQNMGMLIDDLLTFSRLSRAPLKKERVDNDRLVRGILDDLGLPQGRKIDLHLGVLPSCMGDAALLKQVWVNLISNAVKYTKCRSQAVIDIGFEPKPEGDVYFVRDNGTGFDMRYAGKLFGVFQRLHRADEFEGTGVGLAIVQRIINRHGGRIWVEAAVDLGATFFFTLERDKQP